VRFDEVGDDLGVRLGAKVVALSAQLLLQGEVVLDDAVVDDHHLAGAVLVRVGVGVAGLAVGRPAGVADPYRSGGEDAFQAGGEAAELARGLDHLGIALPVQDGDSRAVIAAVLEALQPLEQHRPRLPVPHVADYATHKASPFSYPSGRRSCRRRRPVGRSVAYQSF
jgi:hypothetical protein